MSAAGPEQTARDIIEASLYLVLATADAAGRPWSSRLLEGDEIARGIEAFSRRSVAHGGGEWTSEDVRPGAGLRLYRATADSHWILAKDGQPDHRIPVPLS
jgi:hypothetical protein